MIAPRNHMLFFVALLTLALPLARAQREMPLPLDTSQKPADVNVKLPEYDVASVKENKSGDHMMRIMNTPDGFSCTNIPLTTLIGDAYGIRQDLISGGPGWVNSTGFDVEAKVAGTDVDAFKKLIWRQRNALLQALLADRFKLKVHHETKVLPMYDLIVAKGGPKLKAAAPADTTADAPKGPGAAKPHGMMTMGPGMFKGQGLSMTALAGELSSVLEHTVVDKTGLTGNYDFDLKWTPEEAGPSGDDGSAESGASIFTAVQEQLGLKLQSTRGPVDTLVIDYAEMSSEN
jgi:uncharacterized protein (TIGR03435 family)